MAKTHSPPRASAPYLWLWTLSWDSSRKKAVTIWCPLTWWFQNCEQNKSVPYTMYLVWYFIISSRKQTNRITYIHSRIFHQNITMCLFFPLEMQACDSWDWRDGRCSWLFMVPRIASSIFVDTGALLFISIIFNIQGRWLRQLGQSVCNPIHLWANSCFKKELLLKLWAMV